MRAMAKISRRGFLKIVGVGSGAMAAVAIIPARVLTGNTMSVPEQSDIIRFRAVGGLPDGPFPSYASHVVQGSIDLKSRSGVVTKTVFAGPPEAMSAIAIPGLSRIVRVTGIEASESLLHVTGVIDDRSQLQLGENPSVEFWIDRSAGVVRSHFLGSKVGLRLE